jgi:pyrimidine operon attenuation protein / uracil phosphoribosyltransferase
VARPVLDVRRLARDRPVEDDPRGLGLAVPFDLQALDLVEEPVGVGLVEPDEAGHGGEGDDRSHEHGEDRRAAHSASIGAIVPGGWYSRREVPLTRSSEARKGSDLNEKTVLDREDVRRTLVRIAHEIVEKTGGQGVAVVGIHRRGAVLAARLRDLVGELVGEPVPLGDIDISFYRDDLARREPTAQPVVHASHVDFPVEDTTIVLVDDVLYTGRTVRAAIDALFDYGRPERVQLAVLADRGHRELPIRPDYVGKNLPTARGERVNVRVEEVDGVDEVAIAEHVEDLA